MKPRIPAIAPRRHQGPDDPTGWRGLLSTWMVLLVWLPIVIIGVLHYGTSAEVRWVHDILRRSYYLPIIFAAFQQGLRGGLVAAVVIAISYLPHAFLHPVNFDPARGLEKSLELVLYHVVGTVAGHLADMERRRRVQLQQALDEQQRLTKQLVRAGRLGALGEVVAGIAHEIRNPLHALSGTAEIVDPLIPADAEERKLWEIHVAEIDRLGRVAERFLSFARPQPLQAVPLDLREVVTRLVDLVGAEARRNRIILTTETPDHPVVINGDRDQLAQVALNIAVNGFKAMSAQGGHLRITVDTASHEGDRMHRLRLENDGPPIPEAELETLFDPFHSGHDEGTGLGLSISSRIVEQHGGYIEAANDGLGVSFSVYLPLAPSPAR